MTTIDKTGKIVSQVMENYVDRKESDIFAAIAKQIIHFKSDITTSMGLPAPFIVVAMAVLTSEPADHQTFLHTTFLFADAWTGVSIAEYPLANRTKRGVLTALNKKHQNPP